MNRFLHNTIGIFAALFIATQCANAKPSDIKIKKLSEQNWVEVSTKNFKITTNAKPAKVEKLAVELEHFRYFVSRVLKFSQVEGVPPVNFVVLKDNNSFDRLGFENIGGIFTSNPRGFFSIANGDDFKLKNKRPTWGRHVIFHEMIHYFESNHITKKTFPVWYREGNAEYLATAVHKDNKITFGRLDVLNWRFYSLLKPSGNGYYSVDVEDLFKARDYVKSTTKGKRKRQIETSRFYARSFITMHYLNSSPERRKQLENYVNLLNQDKTVDEAFSEAFAITFEQLTEEIDSYLKGRSVYGRVFKVGEGGFKFPPVEVAVKNLATSEAIFTVADTRLQFGRSSEDIKEIRETIFAQLESLYPEEDELKVIRARYDSRLTIGDRIKLGEDLVAKNPNSESAYLVLGHAYADAASALRRRGNDDWHSVNKKARSAYRKAVRINQFSGEAYQGIGESYRYSPIAEKSIHEGGLCYENVGVLVKVDNNLYRQGHIFAAAGHYEDAYHAYKRYTEVSDSFYSANFITWARDALSLQLVPELKPQEISDNSIRYHNGALYTGAVVDNRPHGEGVLRYSNGVEYRGAWQQGLPHGQGFFVAANGMTYEGDFDEGVVHGKGKLDYKTWTYQGDFYRYMEHGEGVATYDKGKRVISGAWHRGMRHGINRVKIDGGTEHSIEWIMGDPKLDLGEKGAFIGAVDFANMRPKDGARGLCKTSADADYFDCKVSDGLFERL